MFESRSEHFDKTVASVWESLPKRERKIVMQVLLRSPSSRAPKDWGLVAFPCHLHTASVLRAPALLRQRMSKAIVIS